MTQAPETPSDGRVLLITGAAGFIGANACRYFSQRGWQVVALESPKTIGWRLKGIDGITRLKVDITDAVAVRETLLRCRPQFVMNCAAYGSYPSDQRQDLIYRVNFDSVRAMLEVLKDSPGLRGFIQAGSSSEYGFNCAAPRENMACEPDSHFSVSKLGATQLVQFYGRRFNVPAWSLRLSSVYGPLEEFSRLIPQICWKALKGTLPDLASPEISRDFVYIDDVLEAFEAVMMKADSLACGEVYNIGSGICTTLGHLAETAREIFGITDLPRFGQFADRGWDHPSWYANPEKGVAFLGWNVRVPLVDGLRKTYAWMEQNPETVLASEKYSIIQRGKGNVGFGRDAGARRSGNPEAPPQASP